VNYCEKALVTGGAGFIGSHIVDRLLADGVGVVVLDDLSGGNVANLRDHLGKEGFRFVQGDIRDSGLVREAIRGVDVVFHCAALIGVQQSVLDPVLVNDVNVAGTLNVLAAGLDSGVRRFVYASSFAVYGNSDSLPLREDQPVTPISPYGVSKLAAEGYVRTFSNSLQTVCLRNSNVYGPRQTQNEYSGVITQFIANLAQNRPLEIFGDGEQTRDFVHVKDVVEANLLALKEECVSGEVFNIGSGEATTINQLAEILGGVASGNVELVHKKLRVGDIRHSYADISKAEKKLCYRPTVTLREGLRELLESKRTLP